MISAIQSNQILNIILMLVYAVIVRIYSFLDPQLYTLKENDTVLAKSIITFVGKNPMVHSVIALLICYVIAVLISEGANKSRIFNRQNLYPGLFFILLSSFLVEYQTLSPALISLLFVALFVTSIMGIYRNNYSGFAIFNAGLAAITASMIYPPFMIINITALISIGYFNGFVFKDFLKYIFGVIAILIILWSVFFFLDQPIFSEFSHFGWSDYLLNKENWTLSKIVYAIIIGITIILGVLNFYSNMKKKMIDARKKISFFYIMTFTLIFVPFIFEYSDTYYFLALSILGSYFLTLMVDYQRNIIVTEFMHLIILVLLYGFQFNFISI